MYKNIITPVTKKEVKELMSMHENVFGRPHATINENIYTINDEYNTATRMNKRVILPEGFRSTARTIILTESPEKDIKEYNVLTFLYEKNGAEAIIEQYVINNYMGVHFSNWVEREKRLSNILNQIKVHADKAKNMDYAQMMLRKIRRLTDTSHDLDESIPTDSLDYKLNEESNSQPYLEPTHIFREDKTDFETQKELHELIITFNKKIGSKRMNWNWKYHME